MKMPVITSSIRLWDAKPTTSETIPAGAKMVAVSTPATRSSASTVTMTAAYLTMLESIATAVATPSAVVSLWVADFFWLIWFCSIVSASATTPYTSHTAASSATREESVGTLTA